MSTTAATSHNPQAPTASVGACLTCGRVTATRSPTTRTTCACSTRITLHPVVGTTSKAARCDDQCLYARTRRCTCACGGGNHGAGYLDGDTVPGWVRQRDTDQHTRTRAARVQRRQSGVDRRVAATRALLERHPELAALTTDAYRDEDDPGLRLVRAALVYSRPLTDRQVQAALAVLRQDRGGQMRCIQTTGPDGSTLTYTVEATP